MIIWTPGMSIAHIEKEIILTALRFYGYNKATTARSLGISVKTLYNKLESYGVKSQRDPSDKADPILTNKVQAQKRAQMESAVKSGPQKQPVSVRERKEIQEMPSARVANNDTGKSGD